MSPAAQISLVIVAGAVAAIVMLGLCKMGAFVVRLFVFRALTRTKGRR